jgi:dTDP-glucose pyrophosphorylase
MNLWRAPSADLMITRDATLHEAITAIDSNCTGCVCVVSGVRELLGVLTDGDIRRQILKGSDLQELQVFEAMQARPVTATIDFNRTQLLHLMRSRSLAQIPIVDDQNSLIGLACSGDLIQNPACGRKAVIMAGGQGVRLRPLTLQCPKPLLPVAGRPIVEHLIEGLVASGFDDLLLITGYLSHMLEDQLQDGSHLGAHLEYLREEDPRGTAGSLASLPTNFDGDLLVVNGDLMTTLDFSALFETHHKSGADMTMAVREHWDRIDFGVVSLDEEWVRSVDEKPKRRVLVNAGIYVMGSIMRDLIPAGVKADMTDLIHWGLQEGKKIRSFPMREYWLDIGRHDDYKRATQDLDLRALGRQKDLEVQAKPAVIDGKARQYDLPQ